jgi:hypothetical protein
VVAVEAVEDILTAKSVELVELVVAVLEALEALKTLLLELQILVAVGVEAALQVPLELVDLEPMEVQVLLF